MTIMLEIERLSVSYQHVVALADVSLTIEPGEIAAVVGPNGAGKSTLLKAISGTAPLKSGLIRFLGQDLHRVRPVDRPALGIAHVPEGRQIFTDLTVEDNLHLGASRVGQTAVREEQLRLVYELFPTLLERRRQFAGTLSGGQQQMLAIGRGLMLSPKLMLLDEPSLGLAPTVVRNIFNVLRHLNRELRLTVVLVEQRVVETLDYCDTCHVLASGRLVASGGRKDIVDSGAISRAYFGT